MATVDELFTNNMFQINSLIQNLYFVVIKVSSVIISSIITIQGAPYYTHKVTDINKDKQIYFCEYRPFEYTLGD